MHSMRTPGGADEMDNVVKFPAAPEWARTVDAKLLDRSPRPALPVWAEGGLSRTGLVRLKRYQPDGDLEEAKNSTFSQHRRVKRLSFRSALLLRSWPGRKPPSGWGLFLHSLLLRFRIRLFSYPDWETGPGFGPSSNSRLDQSILARRRPLCEG